MLSYREVWYHQRLPEGFRKQLFRPVELALLYATMIVHPLTLLGAVALTGYSLMRATFAA
jgi:hypothetical protein